MELFLMSVSDDSAKPTSMADWHKLLKPYSSPSVAVSLGQLFITVGVFAALMWGTYALMTSFGFWPSLVLAVPAGLFLVRLFIIQHDCGHYSFFKQKWACDLVGRALGVLTMTPYYWWKRDHDWHHATSGDLDRRGYGDIDTLTVAEYNAMSPLKKLAYRAYRHPAVLFGIGPLYQFLVRQRLPLNIRRGEHRAIISILTTNVVIGLVVWGMGEALGYLTLAKMWLPVIVVAATAGVWMFFVQHQFEGTYWRKHEGWSYEQAALKGCSYYKLPSLVEWLTGWISYHHIHHLAAKIPNYRLKACYQDVDHLRDVTTITFRESLRCVPLTLWCETRQRLVSFAEAGV
jgi:omega-6 fatty acid desaturase (delta-12 desaturase)